MRRQPSDRAALVAGRFWRYRCQTAGCGWQGLVDGLALSVPATPARPAVSQIVRKLAAALLAGVALAASAVLLGTHADAGWPDRPEQPLAVGESDDGQAVRVLTPSAPPSPGAALPLALRRGCAWGKPGRNPYQGTVAQALTAARLPADLVGPLADKIRRRETTDRVLISSAAIRTVGSQREFSPKGFSMAFGHMMCQQSRVNFAPGHVEQADFYEVADGAGQKVAVMVPDVCGNVAVLSAAAERDPVRRLLARTVALLQRAFWEGSTAGEPAPAFAVGGIGRPHEVPEPGTLGCVIAALAAWLATSRLRRRR